MRKVWVIVVLLGLLAPSVAVALDIYVLQYGYREGVPCEGASSGNMIHSVYCSKSPTYEVFGSLEAAKTRLRASSPTKAYKIWCWDFDSLSSCTAKDMEIVTDKDLREKEPVFQDTGKTLLWDNVITIKQLNP